MNWSFRNIGTSIWPQDSIVVFVEGEKMEGPERCRLGPVPPGETTTFESFFKTPSTVGSHMGCWRLTCGSGYFGEPLWVVLNVVSLESCGPLDMSRPICQFGASCIIENMDHYSTFCHPCHKLEGEYIVWKANALGMAGAPTTAPPTSTTVIFSKIFFTLIIPC